ncbi:type I methionyl aminopeptidase [Aminithiophilus ramosus]|uniref:Methionine aminopeptidase n=2 Tax=Synergistales TaxID=649776 RepID=A0A9Q7ANS7_9BACT|nr:type I methionyl aminopeptidase [Aminithiophilus ramosus]QTX31506.1 type I methionyl aminopeptidase [Aminithiophilus ramosus]QVL35314.1 type I methionyl aminopeptidase [Synergistota bacterium]
MITLKSDHEIRNMKQAGRIVVDVLRLLEELIVPGVDTLTLDETAEALIVKSGGVPATKGYRVPGIASPYPASLCTSVNDEVVHGIPSRDRILREGDIVSVDIVVGYDRYFGDAARSYPVGAVSEARRDLLQVTRESLDRALAAVRGGATLGDVGHAVESYVKPRGFGLVRDYAGHGIGRHMHEPPQVPNYGKPGRGLVLKPGMTLAIEPMVMSGGERVVTRPDGWTVVTADGSDAAHFEKTVLVTAEGAEILTPWE